MKKILCPALAALLAVLLILPAHAAAGIIFEDVPEDHWAAADIQYVTQRKLFNGVSSTQFDPSGHLNWAMLSTVLYRYAGSPEVSSPAPYADVPEGQWYSDGIAWAYENQIFPSCTLNAPQLGIGDDVRRAEFCIMLYNFAGAAGQPVPGGGSPAVSGQYLDMDPLSFHKAGFTSIYDEAETAMLRWAVPLGIMKGVSDTAMDPLGNITRAEAAAMLSRFDVAVLGGTEPPAGPDPTPPAESEPTPPAESGAAPQLIPVQLIMQSPELPNGCEATSLAILLSCTGAPADKMDVYSNYLPKAPFSWRGGVRYGPDPQVAYAGDASLRNGGWYCFENPVIQAGSAWLQARELPFQIQNLTGLSQEELEQYLGQDIPIVVWATLKCQTPSTSKTTWTLPDGTKYYPYINLHCFLLTGISDNGAYISADPIYGWQSLSPSTFWQVFNSMGRRAVTLVPITA